MKVAIDSSIKSHRDGCMKSKQALVGLALAAIAISLFALPVSAGTRIEKTTKVTWEVLEIFWVESTAVGWDEGNYLSDYDKDWDHGAASDPPPPWIFCYYDWEWSLTYRDSLLKRITTHSWGIIKLKTGEYVDRIDATAYVDADDQ